VDHVGLQSQTRVYRDEDGIAFISGVEFGGMRFRRQPFVYVECYALALCWIGERGGIFCDG
jgi:hypothetical protein